MRGQQTQQTDREPAQEVRQSHGDQTAGYPQVVGFLGGVAGGHSVGSDGGADRSLSRGDQQKEDEVEDDHDAVGVVVAGVIIARMGSGMQIPVWP